MPPEITPLGPRNLRASPLVDQYLLDERAVLESGIDDGLGCDGLASTATFVAGDDDSALAVVDTVPESFSGEAGEDDGVDSTDTSASEESGGGLPCHGEVDGDGIALLDTEIFEDIGDLADLLKEFRVGDFTTLARFIGFPDNRRLYENRTRVRRT